MGVILTAHERRHPGEASDVSTLAHAQARIHANSIEHALLFPQSLFTALKDLGSSRPR